MRFYPDIPHRRANRMVADFLVVVAVALLAPTTLVGGFVGAKLAGRVPEPALRVAVVVVGLAVSIYLFVK